MKALKKKKKLYQHGGKTDPPKGQKNKSKKAKVMGLPSQRVYTGIVPKARQDFSDPSKFGEQYHGEGDLVGPRLNKHTYSGLKRQGKKIRRPVDPTKRGKKGGTGARPAGKK